MSEDMKDYLLKECYEIAERFETKEISKMILREKIKNIGTAYEGNSQCDSDTSTDSYMQSISEIIRELSTEGLDVPTAEDFRLSHIVSSIPECAEKNYILALLELRRGTNETHRLAAIRYVESALAEELDDPRFRTLAEILKNA